MGAALCCLHKLMETKLTCETMCPLIINKPDLCKAALSSLMIDDKACLNESHNRCPIFLINESGCNADLNVSDVQVLEENKQNKLQQIC